MGTSGLGYQLHAWAVATREFLRNEFRNLPLQYLRELSRRRRDRFGEGGADHEQRRHLGRRYTTSSEASVGELAEASRRLA